MTLSCAAGESRQGVLWLSFNQDNSCVAIGTRQGIRIFGLENNKICYEDNIGAISVAEMLFCTSLLAIVGAGEQPALSPRRLRIINTASSGVIQDLHYGSAVLAVRIARTRLVAVLERKAHVYELETLDHLRALDTAPNPGGVCALSVGAHCQLALPARSATPGCIRVYDIMVDGGNVLAELPAHRHNAAVMAWHEDGKLLASASTKGTVVKVHSLPSATKEFTFRRGAYPAAIHSLAFTPPAVQPPFLAACSGNGTVHLFRCAAAESSSGAAGAAGGGGITRTIGGVAFGLLKGVVPASVSDIATQSRTIAALRLPSQGSAAIAAIPAGSVTTNEGEEGPSRLSVVAVSVQGIMYEFTVTGLNGPGPAQTQLEREISLLGTSMLPVR